MLKWIFLDCCCCCVVVAILCYSTLTSNIVILFSLLSAGPFSFHLHLLFVLIFSSLFFFCLPSSFAFNRFNDFRHVIKYSILCLCAGCCGSKYLRALQWIVVYEDVVFIYKYVWKYLHSSILNDSWAYAVCIAAILMCTPMYVWKFTMRNSKIRKFLSL